MEVQVLVPVDTQMVVEEEDLELQDRMVWKMVILENQMNSDGEDKNQELYI